MTDNDDTVDAAMAFIKKINSTYLELHSNYETQFWGTKMALTSTPTQPYSPTLLSSSQSAMINYLSNPTLLTKAQSYLSSLSTINLPPDNDLVKVLAIIIKTCTCHQIPTEARIIREEMTFLENTLEQKRNRLALGYININTGVYTPATPIALRNVLRTDPVESHRRQAYHALSSIGPFICSNGFLELVKKRNKFAKILGFEDYYEYKLQKTEGFGKQKLFEILNGLEEGTRDLIDEALENVNEMYGERGLEAWNRGFLMGGGVMERMDPYFPFAKSIERYLHSYAALGINYHNATLTLDLLSRPHKHPHAVCHYPTLAHTTPIHPNPPSSQSPTHAPSCANFTSYFHPTHIGSGLRALTTLMHEAGHVAHFANVAQPSPLFSQERIPTSVAYTENQAMFLDALVGDAAWRARYAVDANQKKLPMEVIEEEIRCTQPFAVLGVREMLGVSYFEKELYEMEEVTMEEVLRVADEVERRVMGGCLSERPLLSLLDLLREEGSCYYQGYTLAEMSVHQTREYFMTKYGSIVDNPHVGPTLTESYWKCGNSRPFLSLVKKLTGKELSGDAWIKVLEESVEERIERERREYEAALVEMNDKEERGGDDDVDVEGLNLRLVFKDGDHLISDSKEVGLLQASRIFETFVTERVAAEEAAAVEETTMTTTEEKEGDETVTQREEIMIIPLATDEETSKKDVVVTAEKEDNPIIIIPL